MGALADSQHFAAGGFVHFSQSINEHPRRIDDHAGRSFQFGTALSVPKNGAGYFVAYVIKQVVGGKETKVALPPAARAGSPRWSADGKRFVFTNTTSSGIELWMGETATGKLRRLLDGRLNTALDAIAGGATILSLYPFAVFCAATAIVAFRTRALPRWLAVGAAVTAAALVVNGAFLGTGSVFALLLFVLWILLASVHLLRRTWRKPVRVPQAEAVARV